MSARMCPSGYRTRSLALVFSSPALALFWSPSCSLNDLLGHGDTGGDGRTLVVALSGDGQSEIGGRVFSALNDALGVENGGGPEISGELKVSRGFASGGDIRLRIDGNRVMLVELRAWKMFVRKL